MATEVVTSLAIASALRHLDMPVLVVNCTAEGASKKFMDTLRDAWNFDLIDLPLNVHGLTLDYLFREINVDRLTILDSDAEVTTPDLMKRVRSAFDNDRVYGAGFIHRSDWLTGDQTHLRVNSESPPMIYAERPWIPFATFRTSYVRAALASGSSFEEEFRMGVNDDLVVDPTLLQQGTPAVTHGDTGALIHGWMAAKGLHFDGPPAGNPDDGVRHYHGVSRHALSGAGNSTPLDKIENEVLVRLRNDYDPFWTGFAEAVQAVQGN